MNVVLFFSGLGRRGGISPDLKHLGDALEKHGVHPTVTGRFRDLLDSIGGGETVVNVYGCLPSWKNIAAMLVTRLRGQRLVWTPVFHPRRRSTWKGAGLYRIMAVFDKFAPHLAKISHAVSAATEEEAEFFRTMGAPCVEVIPLVVGETHQRLYGPDRIRARTRLGVSEEPVVLLVAAHSPRRKGMSFAAQVLAELQAKLSRVTFLVVGGGNLGELAGIPGVKPLGWCPDNLLLDAYRSADLLFVPSLYEQFSRATIEAWACELPVILSDGVALAPIAEMSGAGIVVPYQDVTAAVTAMAKALENNEWLTQAGKQGRRLVEERYLPSAHLQATLELYRSIA